MPRTSKWSTSVWFTHQTLQKYLFSYRLLSRSFVRSLTQSLTHSLIHSLNIMNYYIGAMLKLSSRLITKHDPGEVNYSSER